MKHLFGKMIFLKDITLNIIASLLLTVATQLLAFPYLSRIMTASEYGVVLTLIGIVNALGVSLGNSLNNTRLLLQSEYEARNTNGDFNLIFLFLIVPNVILVYLMVQIISQETFYNTLIYVLLSLLVLFRSYYSVGYRIKINYKLNLYSSVFGLVGYIIGIYVTNITGNWIFTFVIGEFFISIFILYTSDVIKEKFIFTNIYKRVVKKFCFIYAASIVSTLVVYMDRFFIFPTLGADKVAIYNVASFLGKTVGIVMIPVSSVLLTYYVKTESITLVQFYKRTAIFTVFSMVVFSLILIFGEPILTILYPTLIDNSLKYFWIANLGAVVFILGNTLQPTLLRYCPVKWQPIIQISYLFLYILFGFIGLEIHGLLGFCYAVLAVNIIKIFLMVAIVTFSIKKERSE